MLDFFFFGLYKTFLCFQLVKSIPLEGHTEAVCAVDAVYQSDEPDLNLLIASAASDSTVRIWSRRDSEGRVFFVFFFLLNLGTMFCFLIERQHTGLIKMMIFIH